MSSTAKLTKDGLEAGFTSDQIEFLLEHFSRPGHHHTGTQIDLKDGRDLEEAIDDIEGDDEDDEPDEQDDVHAASHFGEYEDEG